MFYMNSNFWAVQSCRSCAICQPTDKRSSLFTFNIYKNQHIACILILLCHFHKTFIFLDFFHSKEENVAEVGVAFLSAILGVVFNKMDSPGVADFIRRRKSIDTLLEKMKIAMPPMNMVLEDAEEKQVTNPNVQKWIDELKDVAYKAEDILDEIATEALQRNLDAEFHPVAGKVRNLYSSIFLNPFVHQVEPKIKEILDRLRDLTNQMNVMALKEVGGKLCPERLTTTSYVIESDTFGRDEDKKKVIELLLSSDAERNEMCGVIAIVGMGGIGKTTLAQLVYNDSRVKQHFNLKIWFCVSEDFVVAKIKKSIIEIATLKACDIENPELLQVALKENLNGKKFLLILDDVWSEEPNHMEFLGQLLHFGAPGSKILVTTRNATVALALHANATHHLELLSEDDCWSLFEKRAFLDGSSSYDADPEIKEIGRQIVNKCKGLPLAIKAIGDLLWSELDVEKWTKILKSDLWDVSKEILPALRLSYMYLPSHLKRCFAYCSIFPKDYVFKKNELVLLWMAEGFLQQSKQESMEEVGNRYFHALVSRSLFQQSSETNLGFVMHDLVNDLAKFVSGRFGFMLEGDNSLKEIGTMTRYLGFNPISSYLDLIRGDHLYRAKQLRTFMAFDSQELWNQSVPEIKLSRALCFLRVLSPSGNMRIERTNWLDSISKMKYLHYLDVSSSDIRRLPNSICMLCNLQTLKLSRCWDLERLPKDMWKLINLRHLEFDRTYRLVEMPVKMDRLKCLQTLTKFIVNLESCSLFESFLIRGGLLHTLKELRISDCKKFDLPMNQQYPSLEILLLYNSCDSLTSFPLDPFPNVKSIIIDGCRNLKSLEHDLEGELVISKIEIRRCSSFVSFPKGGLRAPKLDKFCLEDCESLESFPEGGLPYSDPNMLQIEIKGCERLIVNWTGWGLETLPFLISLMISGESKDVESFPGELLLPTTLVHLGIYSFPNLKSLDNEGFQRLTSLYTLQIESCPKLMYLPEEGFPASLNFLTMRKCNHVLMKELKRKRGKEWLKVAHIHRINV